MINLDKVRADWVDNSGPVGNLVALLCDEIEALRRFHGIDDDEPDIGDDDQSIDDNDLDIDGCGVGVSKSSMS